MTSPALRFRRLTPVELARLVGEIEEVALPPGGVVFRRGDPGDCVYVVRAGVAEARAGPGDDDDDEYPLTLYEPGESFGESALLTDEPRSTSVVALSDLQLWALPKDRFRTLVEGTPGLALAVGRALSRRLQATHQAVSSLHGAFDALAEQAYAELEPELRAILRRLAPLDPLPVDLAARALDRPDAGQVLADLDARLPFVRAENGLYRSHRLFRELLDDKLRAELGPAGHRDWLRHLAEHARSLGYDQQALALFERAENGASTPSQPTSESEALGPPDDQRLTSGPGLQARLRGLAARAGLRRITDSAGALGGRGLSRPIGVVLALGLLFAFLLTPPPPELSRQAYLALGILAAALPLLVFSVLGDHYVTLIMAAAWAACGLVPARVALSGFATPGWFLVLAVLAVGVALARCGLLYRLVLALLARVPSHPALLGLALAGVGVLFSPAMPNATARTALVAPLTAEIVAAVGYAPRSRGSAALGLAVLLGFGQMCSLFLTGSSSGLLVHSLLPPDSRARFGWVSWFLAAIPLHLVIFGVTFLAIGLVLRPGRPTTRSSRVVQAQRQILGPWSREERIAAVVFVALVTAFVLGPLIGLDPAWPAVLAMVVLGATNVLDPQGFRTGINWVFLIFFGVMLSLAEVFSTLKVDVWLAEIAAKPLTPLAANPALVLVTLGLAGYVLNLVVRWQAACVLMSLVLIPAVAPLGVEPWVVGMTALVTTNMWFFPYQSTIYQALYYGSNEQVFTQAQTRPIALIYGLACLLGLVASVPFWQALGLLPRQ